MSATACMLLDCGEGSWHQILRVYGHADQEAVVRAGPANAAAAPTAGRVHFSTEAFQDPEPAAGVPATGAAGSGVDDGACAGAAGQAASLPEGVAAGCSGGGAGAGLGTSRVRAQGADSPFRDAYEVRRGTALPLHHSVQRRCAAAVAVLASAAWAPCGCVQALAACGVLTCCPPPLPPPPTPPPPHPPPDTGLWTGASEFEAGVGVAHAPGPPPWPASAVAGALPCDGVCGSRPCAPSFCTAPPSPTPACVCVCVNSSPAGCSVRRLAIVAPDGPRPCWVNCSCPHSRSRCCLYPPCPTPFHHTTLHPAPLTTPVLTSETLRPDVRHVEVLGPAAMCGVVWCGVVWCGVVWCGVVWCGVVWCGVVWCAVRPGDCGGAGPHGSLAGGALHRVPRAVGLARVPRREPVLADGHLHRRCGPSCRPLGHSAPVRRADTLAWRSVRGGGR